MSILSSSFSSFLNWPRWQKRIFSLAMDGVALPLAVVLAIGLRFGETLVPVTQYWHAIVLLPLIAIPVFVRMGLYRSVIRYIGIRFAYTVFIAVTLSVVIWSALLFMLDLQFPRSGILITWLLALLLITGSRIIARSLFSGSLIQSRRLVKKRILIYGAGSAGQQLFNAVSRMPFVKVVGFIDECSQLQNNDIRAIRVFQPEDLEDLIENQAVTDVFLAIPSLSAKDKKRILKWLEPLQVKVSILPPMDKIVDGNIEFSDVKEVGVDDLLGREVVPPKQELLEQCIRDQVVLVSGAGGSIGSELTRQVVKLKPRRLILLELSEFALYQIDKELEASDIEVISFLGSVLDVEKLDRIFKRFDVNTVYHAAAYKHVPLVEHNIAEGIQNNAFGTYQFAKAAAENQVSNFVLISTDKAVRPTNFMGATKRMAELSLQALQQEYIETRFAMVRFGNVLGSSGSVIPLFRKQIKQGGPITVTHAEINRFFMTISEAASLVIQAGSMGTGGDVFVLDMGEPVKIVDLAKRMIRLSGLTVVDEVGQGDIEIQFTGLRPGEKLYEELLIGDEVKGTAHPKIMTAHEYSIPLDELEKHFKALTDLIESGDYEQLQQRISQIVKGFNHTSGVVDYLS